MASSRPLRAAKTMAIDMLLLGKTGTGKSSTGNSILGRNIFEASDSSTSVTADIKSQWSGHKCDDGRYFELKVTDGPGLEDTNLSSKQDKKRAYINITKVMSECPQGIHAFLVVVRLGFRFTKEDKNSLDSLKEILGNDFLAKFGVIIVAGGDQLYRDDESKTFEDWCREQEGALKRVMQECDNRCVLFDNTTKDEALKKKQLDTLFELVLEIMSRNNGERYTNETFKKHEESHKRLLAECDLTCVKEEFRKQLSMLGGEVRKMADNKNNEPNEAHEMLQTLLEQVEYEMTLTPRLERLQNDLLDLQQFLTEMGKLKENEKPYASVLKEATKQCEKMIKAASPPLSLDWLENILESVEQTANTVGSFAAVGGKTGKALAGVGIAVGVVAKTAAWVIKYKTELEYHY